MKTRSAWIALVALGCLALPTRLPAQGKTDFLKLVPSDAIGFGVVHNISDMNAKSKALVKLAGVPVPDEPLALIKAQAGVDKGLDEKGSLIMVLMAGDGGPQAVLLVPVTDYKEFVTPLKPKDASGAISEFAAPSTGTAMLVAKKGNYAAFAEAEQKGSLEKVLSAKTDIATSAASLQTFLSSNDGAIVWTGAAVKMFSTQMREGLKQIKAIAALAGPEAQFAGPMLDSLENLIKSAETDVSFLTVGLQIDTANNVKLSLQALFAKGSGFAKAADGVKPLEGGPLVGLPAGAFMMAGGGVYPEGSSEGLMNFSMQMLKVMAKDLPKEKMKKLEDAMVDMGKGLHGMTMMYGVGKEKEPLLSGVYGLIKVDDAPGYLTRYEKGMKAMNEIMKDANVPGVGEYDIKKVEVAGVTALEITTDMSKALANAAAPVDKNMLETIFGKDGKMTITMAAVDNKTILSRYSTASSLKDFLDAYKQKKEGLAANAEVAKTMALLPTGSQWAFFVSPDGIVEFARRTVAAVAPGQIQIPAFPKSPPLGVGVKLSAAGLETQIALPAGVLENIGIYSRKLGAGVQ